MTTQELLIPEVEPLQHESSALLSEAQQITAIADTHAYERAALCKRGLVARRIFIGDFFKPLKQSVDAHKRTILDRERLVLDPVVTAETRIGVLMVAYDDEQERQRRLDEKKAQEDAQLAEAQHYEALGDTPAMEATLDGNGVVQVKVNSVVPKIAGISFRETWSAEVTDLRALVKAVAEGKAPLAYLQANSIAINQAARSLKTELNTIPGLKAIVTKTAIGRR